MSASIHFDCTQCGACCRDRLIPLTLQESVEWLSRDHRVVLLTESFTRSDWQGSEAEYQHQLKRSFAVQSPEDELRVIVIVAGDALQVCPNLGEDNRCGIYTERPHVCRIYPLEVSPFIQLRPEQKSCPPQAWGRGPVIVQAGEVVDELDQKHIKSSRETDYRDSLRKKRLCQILGVDVAAWKGDGLMGWQFEPETLMAALANFDSDVEQSDFWTVHTVNDGLRSRLNASNAKGEMGLPAHTHFYPLSS